jgi:hypothetical protein
MTEHAPRTASPGPDQPGPDVRGHLSPPPTAGFVADTLARIEQDGDVAWSRVLAHHKVPPPGAEFVARTAARIAAAVPAPMALRPLSGIEATDGGGQARRWRPRTVATAVAAGLVLGIGGWVWLASGPGAGGGARSPWSLPSPVATIFGRAAGRDLPVVRSDFFTRVRFDPADSRRLLLPEQR